MAGVEGSGGGGEGRQFYLNNKIKEKKKNKFYQDMCSPPQHTIRLYFQTLGELF